MFQPIAVETLGRINESAVQLLDDLGHGITSVCADDKEGQFLFQRLSIALQRFNAILLHESFGVTTTGSLADQIFFIISLAFNPRDL